MSKFYTTKVFINNKFFRNALAIAESISDAKKQFDKIEFLNNHTIGKVSIVRHYGDGTILHSDAPVLIMSDNHNGIGLFGCGRVK